MPEITEPISFESVIDAVRAKHQGLTNDDLNRLMFSERDGESLEAAIEKLPVKLSMLTALIGSEGGWTDEELAAAQQAGWNVVTLGGRTLRSETAAIAVAVVLQHRFGDLV